MYLLFYEDVPLHLWSLSLLNKWLWFITEQSFKWGCKPADHEMNIRNKIEEISVKAGHKINFLLVQYTVGEMDITLLK